MVKKPGNGDSSPWKSREFLLVLFLLVALIITEALVFWLVSASSRDEVLALTFGAFGAWIGAGAAYFFGRENLRVATDSMLRMRGRSPEEILSGTKLADMKPRPLPTKFKEKVSTIGEIVKWLKEDLNRFFVVVVDDKDEFKCTLDEEAIYLYIHDSLETHSKEEPDKPFDHDAVCGLVVGKVIEHYTSEEKKEAKRLIEAAVKLSDDSSALIASDMMERDRKFVTIVVDDKDHPTGYITTGDIRKLVATSERTESQ